MEKNKGMLLKILTLIFFLAVVTVNALSALLPIAGKTPGQVSDSYPNLFAPAGITFAIWSLIYLLLAGFAVFQFKTVAAGSALTEEDMKRVRSYFALSCLANISWIFCWHYGQIVLSACMIVLLLICLIMISSIFRGKKLNMQQRVFLRLPFSVYYGWLTVATIANIVVLLVSLGWHGAPLSEVFWTCAVIATGLIIGAASMIKNRDLAYGLVIIWAYSGIIIKHVSAAGFAGRYPAVVATAAVCIGMMLVCGLYVIMNKRRAK